MVYGMGGVEPEPATGRVLRRSESLGLMLMLIFCNTTKIALSDRNVSKAALLSNSVFYISKPGNEDGL